MNFTSQICTTKEQSERLLGLGLRKETADCILVEDAFEKEHYLIFSIADVDEYFENELVDEPIPAWSLNRLIEMMPKEIFHESKQWHLFLSLCYEDAISYEECDSSKPDYLHFCSSDNIYDNIIESIEWLIKEGYFNKEYLN